MNLIKCFNLAFRHLPESPFGVDLINQIYIHVHQSHWSKII